MRRKRLLLGASYSIIEPLGLLHLAGLARDEGWDRKFHLVKDHDFESFFETVREFKPDVVGFNVYTGNHLQLFDAFKRLKKDDPNIATIVGGPHPTYFPAQSSENADYVMMSEGFGALRKILNGKATPGILPMDRTEEFPHPDRQTFYTDYPEHASSRIKSIITMTGCPYTCTYCYNSSTPKEIRENVPPEIAEKLGHTMGMGGRLFPHNVRTVEDIVKEGQEMAERWSTEIIYCQDDVHGFDIRDWMPKFAELWRQRVDVPYHAQMRWEMTAHEGGKQRLDLLRKAGCFGLTLAIEAADPHIRKEVLDRAMPQELIVEGMRRVIDRDFNVRTEQISALPYGGTTEPTEMNLDADLELNKFNVDLKRATGGPTMAWLSTFAPYAGTKLGIYSRDHGHYLNLENNDVPDTFFERSVLRFPREWLGPKLKKRKNDPGIWLREDQLERYRDQNAELRRHFNFFALVPEGDRLAASYLKSIQPFSYERLGRETLAHLESLARMSDREATRILDKISSIRKTINFYEDPGQRELTQELNSLAPYFASLPRGELAVQRSIRYARQRYGGILTPQTISDAVRHHLYDNVLYATEDSSRDNSRTREHIWAKERYPSKV